MFKRKKKKTGCETPEFRSKVPMPPVRPPKPPTSGSNAVKPNPNYVPPASTPRYNPPPMPSVKPAKKENKTMYGLKLYIPFEDLEAYIHDHIEEAHKDHTFIPVKAEINELDLGIEISLISAVPNEFDDCRYKLNLNKLPKEN